jgi:predicted regulator of amino acid metabolism with ACT domain
MKELGSASMRINQGLTIDVSAIDIQQGAIAWETLVNRLGAGKTIQAAVNDANAALDAFYGTITSWPNDIRLAEVQFKVVGNKNVCPKCKNR